MFLQYLKAIMDNTVVEEKNDLEASESCDDLDDDSAAQSNHSMGGPMRGRSVKEYEEQLANLKKENFNLKLRIYFLEERMGVNFNLEKEDILKDNVDLKVQVEHLRKEVQDKHDLLCQAVKAIELEEDEQKKLAAEKEEAIAECHQEIESLKFQLNELKAENEVLASKSYESAPTEFFSYQVLNIPDSSCVIKELQERVQFLEEELNEEKENNAAIQIIFDQNVSQIKNLTSQLEEANKKLINHNQEVEEMRNQLDEARNKCENFQKKLHEKTQLLERLSVENEEMRNRQSLLNGDLEKERKRYDKLKAHSDQKIADLHCKLEASLAELKKSQELVFRNQQHLLDLRKKTHSFFQHSLHR